MAFGKLLFGCIYLLTAFLVCREASATLELSATHSAKSAVEETASKNIIIPVKKYAEISSVPANDFAQALSAFTQGKPKKAEQLFLNFLQAHPFSYPARYNLALAYYQQKNLAYALAIWRQLLFEQPFDSVVRQALMHTQSQIPHYSTSHWRAKMPWGATPVWLWVPPDVILSVITIFWGILILFLYYRKYQVIWLWLIPMIACHIGAGYYFSFRWNDYATLIEDIELRSAPQKQAVILSTQTAGQLVKIKQQLQDWAQVTSGLKNGWILSSKLVPVKKAMKSRHSPLYSGKIL